MDEITPLLPDPVPDLQRIVQRKLGRCMLQLPEQRYAETKAALKKLVYLRNELEHHFLQRFELWGVDGCIAAEAYLDESYETIDCHYLRLRDWANSMDEAR